MKAQKILCLSGWGQKFDSLEFIFKDQAFDPFFVESIDYSIFADIEEFFDFVRKKFTTSPISQTQTEFFIDDSAMFSKAEGDFLPEIIIGWSLGGQLAVRLIEHNILKPKLLILIAPPFQLVKDSRIQAGMALATFKKFRDDFANAPDQTLKQFSILTAMNDRNASDIARSLDVNDKNFSQLVYWLDELARFSCFDIDFSNMPRVLYFHGAGDMIVPAIQAQYFKERIQDFHAKVFVQCGHAPQLSNIESLRRIIIEEINSQTTGPRA